MQPKTAIVILSDPRSGGEEALGHLFNALATAHELEQADQPVRVLFMGTGTRWPGALADAGHPAHDLFEAVRGVVAGVSCGCAEVFGAKQDAQACGLPLLADNAVPGTSGTASLLGLLRDGERVLTF
jgi:hypothetical protein